MAGGLPKKREEFHKIPGEKVAIIASMWHAQCVEPMVDRCVSELRALDCKDIEIHYLPGSYELPMAAQFLFKKKPDLDVVIAFGVVLTGATAHNITVLQEITNGFSHIMRDTGKVIINEVIGVSDIQDAVKRSGNDNWNKGLEAAFAASEVLVWRKKMR
jgi:6,7-dimethyl-8-ribityllumazine synthase